MTLLSISEPLDINGLTVPRQLLVAGKWQDASNGDTVEVINPSDASVITDIADADEPGTVTGDAATAWGTAAEGAADDAGIASADEPKNDTTDDAVSTAGTSEDAATESGAGGEGSASDEPQSDAGESAADAKEDN